MTAICQPALNQIALSVVDLQETDIWFREGLGFLPASGSRILMSSPLAAMVQGLPKAASTCWWLVGRNPWFQLELFQFSRPLARLMPADFRPWDIGYTRMGIHVADFDEALGNLARLGSAPLAPVQGERGRRRACVRTPDGVYVEIMEEDPLPGHAAAERPCKVAVRSVTLSTPDLAASIAYISAIAGRAPGGRVLHHDAHEALWGGAGATCRRAVFECGDMLLELVEYSDPAGKPWPKDYRISDQGILNIAFGVRQKEEHKQVYKRALAVGARPNHAPIYLPGMGMLYVNDPLGFSVEIVRVAPGNDWSFVPEPPESRPRPCNECVRSEVTIAAPPEHVWRVLNDHDDMARWLGADRVSLVLAGSPDPSGYGAERMVKDSSGTVVEQIVGVVPGRRIRYRIIEGSPFSYHGGEIAVAARGDGTEVTWTVRFRSKNPLRSGALRRRMKSRLAGITLGLKRHAEQHRAG